MTRIPHGRTAVEPIMAPVGGTGTSLGVGVGVGVGVGAGQRRSAGPEGEGEPAGRSRPEYQRDRRQDGCETW